MDSKKLSDKASIELKYIIYKAVSRELDDIKEGGTSQTVDRETMKEILEWYEDNIIISYDALKDKFENIE